MADNRSEALRRFVEKLSGRKTTEIRVIGTEDRGSYRVVLLRGKREAELPKKFPCNYVDDYPGTREYQAELKSLVDATAKRLLLPRQRRLAGILMALEEHNQDHPGELMSGLFLEASYQHYADGDVLQEQDLLYLCEKDLIEFYRRSGHQYGGAVPLVNARTGPALDILDHRALGVMDQRRVARILATGQDWLEDWRQSAPDQNRRLYEVFVSSCQDELEDERLAAREAVEEQEELRTRFRVVSFEQDLSPSRGSAQTITVEAAGRCDIYIGIFGTRYGDVGDDGVSPTEREYRAAVADGRIAKPIWIFRHAKCAGKEEPRLKTLLDEISNPQTGHIYREFRNYKELKLAIQQSLRRYIEQAKP
jgi:hypothetical protein